jgi:hypothetical protein
MINWTALTVFIIVGFVTWIGFAGAGAGDLTLLRDGGWADAAGGTIVTWFLTATLPGYVHRRAALMFGAAR